MPKQAPAYIDNKTIEPAVWVFSLEYKSPSTDGKNYAAGHIEINTPLTLSDLADKFLVEIFQNQNASNGRITCSSNPDIVLGYHEDNPKMTLQPKQKNKLNKGFSQ